MAYLHFNGHVYEIRTDNALQWGAANASAVQLGGYLARIGSAAENAAIYNFVKNQQEHWTQHNIARDGGGAEYVWIGAKDTAVEGQWKWTDGTTFFYKDGDGQNLYSNWGGNATTQEPDDYTDSQVSPDGQDGGALALTNWGNIGVAGQWNDIAMNNELFYLVEYDTAGSNNVIPTGLTLSRSAVAENAATNSVVGTFSAVDGDGDTLTYTIMDPTGAFAIEQNRLVLKKALDYETARQHTITAQVDDGYGGIISKVLTVDVTDVSEPSVPGTPTTPTSVVLIGTRSQDRLVGGAGDDMLSGGFGNDTLDGGAGSDIFVFNAKLSKTNKLNKKQNLDTILGFNPDEDTIHLKKGVFSKLGKTGVLKKNAFYTGTKAHDGDDRIIYNKNTGALSYDKDGKGGAEAIQFAKLDAGLKITNADFLVI
jgi:hypothetical protein